MGCGKLGTWTRTKYSQLYGSMRLTILFPQKTSAETCSTTQSAAAFWRKYHPFVLVWKESTECARSKAFVIKLGTCQPTHRSLQRRCRLFIRENRQGWQIIISWPCPWPSTLGNQTLWGTETRTTTKYLTGIKGWNLWRNHLNCTSRNLIVKSSSCEPAKTQSQRSVGSAASAFYVGRKKGVKSLEHVHQKACGTLHRWRRPKSVLGLGGKLWSSSVKKSFALKQWCWRRSPQSASQTRW